MLRILIITLITVIRGNHVYYSRWMLFYSALIIVWLVQ